MGPGTGQWEYILGDVQGVGQWGGGVAGRGVWCARELYQRFGLSTCCCFWVSQKEIKSFYVRYLGKGTKLVTFCRPRALANWIKRASSRTPCLQLLDLMLRVFQALCQPLIPEGFTIRFADRPILQRSA